MRAHMSNIAVIYYSSTGHVHKLAEAVEQGARDAGADVRLRRVAELASEDVIRRQAVAPYDPPSRYMAGTS